MFNFIDNIADKFSSFILAGTRIVAILLDNDKAGNSTAEQIKQGLDEMKRKVKKR